MPGEPERRVSTIRLEGMFDLPAARLLEHSLRSVCAGDRVVVDFSRVRQFNDFGVPGASTPPPHGASPGRVSVACQRGSRRSGSYPREPRRSDWSR